jgi:hypothetical protein
MNLISREKLKQFHVAELVEFQECLYQGIETNSLRENSFNNYLLKHNLCVTEDQLNEVIDEKLKEYKPV